MKCKKGVDAPKYAPEFFAASCKGFFSGTFFGSRVWAPLCSSSVHPPC